MKRAVRSLITQVGRVISRVFARFRLGRIFLEGLHDESRESYLTIGDGRIDLKLVSPTPLIRWRNETLFEKEPETIRWIDSHEKGACLWDVGANIGLYSVYAAKSREISVVSFEPSVFNLEVLARNIVLNEVTNRVVIVPIALNDRPAVARFDLSSTSLGGALSTFEHGVSYSGEILSAKFSYQTIGLNLDAVVETFGLPAPDYIKIDVDGIEHMILKGGERVLRSCKSVLVEVDDNFVDQACLCREFLVAAGFKLGSKEHSGLMALGRFSGLYNQIWVRQ